MKTILVVEDNPAILDMLIQSLERAGYRVNTSVNGEILQYLQHPLPDLILLDILLPDADGRILCDQLKQQEITRHIPVILFSAHLQAKENWEECGADALLLKPFHLKALLNLLTVHLAM